MYSELPEKPPAVSKYVLSMCRLSGRFCLAAKCIFLVSFIFLMLLPTLAPGQTTFAQEQNNYPRVRQARINREDTLDSLFNSSHIEYPPSKIMIVAYKQERQLELWAKPETLDVFSRLVTYPFTAFCGDLGPKRMQGDLQIPEGFYHIDDFNPASRFHLSLRINYPNRSDSILGVENALGGEIFIHGSCVTIGCIPIGDDAIEELYITCVDTKSQGQTRIPVYIFPCHMDSIGMRRLELLANNDTTLLSFWQNIGEGYEILQEFHEELHFSFNENGKYIFNNN